MKRSLCLIALCLLTLYPSTALANAGTPLMWASVFHLILGNAIIGVVEGLLLAGMFKCLKWKSILLLVVANYVSAWVGMLLVAGYLPTLVDITIENVKGWFLFFVLLAFMVTLLIEFPFFWSSFGFRTHRFKRPLLATLVVNALSYVFIFGWYWSASGTSMMTQLDVVPVASMQLPDAYDLYYLTTEGDLLVQVNLNDFNEAPMVAEVSAPHRNDRLFVRSREDDRFDLFVRLASDERGEERMALLLPSFSSHAAVDSRLMQSPSEGEVQGTWFNFGDVPSLVEGAGNKYSVGFWASEGVRRNFPTGVDQRFSLETPFVNWNVRNATHLVWDYLVFQLGEDQICLMNVETKQIALIARGKGPVVVKGRSRNEVELL